MFGTDTHCLGAFTLLVFTQGVTWSFSRQGFDIWLLSSIRLVLRLKFGGARCMPGIMRGQQTQCSLPIPHRELREKKTYSKLELHRYKSKTPTYVATNEKILHIVIQVRRESDGVESRKIRENCVGLPWDMKYCTTDKRFINVEHRVHKSSTGLFHSRVSDMK